MPRHLRDSLAGAGRHFCMSTGALCPDAAAGKAGAGARAVEPGRQRRRRRRRRRAGAHRAGTSSPRPMGSRRPRRS